MSRCLNRYNLWWGWSLACACWTTGKLHHAGWRPWVCALSPGKLHSVMPIRNTHKIYTSGHWLVSRVLSLLWRVWQPLKRQSCGTRQWSPCVRFPTSILQWTWKFTLSLWWSAWPAATGSHHVPLPVGSSVSATLEFPALSKLRSASKFVWCVCERRVQI